MFFGKIKLKYVAVLMIVLSLANQLKASHGMALVTPAFTVGAACVTYTASSNAATCGGGPYWLQVEVRCTANQLTGTPPATMQTNLLNWTGPGVTYNNFPWYNSLLNVPNYSLANFWPDNCVTEPYHPVVICYNNFCPGQVYWFAAREWVSGTNSVGPWTAAASFTVPGVFVPLNANASANPAVYCSPGNSTLTVNNITGGCGASSVQWLPGNMTGTSVVVSPAATTIYTALISTPCNTITRTTTVTVVPVVSAAFTPLNSSACANTPVNLNHTGTAGVSHTWAVTPATGVTLSSPTATNPTVTFANPGNYTISHTVAIGTCSNVVTTNITINGLTPAFTIPSPTQCITGNSFNFNAANINGTHTYAFNPSVGAPLTGNTPNYSGSFTAPGTYTVTHTVNHNGCITSTTGVVVVNPTPSAILTITNAVCSQNTGIIVINNTSGPGQTITGMTLNGNPIATQTITGLAPGNYTLVQTNNFGCTMTTTTSIGNTPGITALAHTFTNATCGFNNGIISAGAVTGGSPTYSYSINNGPFTTNNTFTGLGAGTYTLTVRDINNCTFSKTVTITNTVPPSAILFTTAPTACNANTGIIGITGVTGGVAPYTFSVNGVGTGSTTTALSAGPKTITVMDAAGCTFSVIANINTVVGPSAATVSVTAAACGNPNGSATVTAVTGGQAPYQYSFNGGPLSTNSVLINQAAGPKNVVIQDANGCTFTVNFNIGNTGSPSSAVSTVSNVSCFGGSNGSFTLNTVGGVPNYNYTLTPGNTTSGFGFFTNLTAQNYTINVQDAVGCVTTVTVAITQPPALTLTPSSLPPSCNGGTNGTITVLASGGTGPYQFNLNGGPNQTSNVFTGNIPSGSYNITVIDNKGCTLTQSVQVTQPTPVTLTLSTQNSNCSSPNGVASVTATGGAGGYTYTWSPTGGNNPQTTGVMAGSYTVTVKDQNGCQSVGSIVVNATPGGTAIITNNTPVSCFGFNNGSATAGGTGGFTAPLTYSWSNNQTTQTATNLTPGTYTVTVTDVFGCKSSTTVVITQPAPLNFATSSSSVLCFNGSSGSASATAVTGGNPGYTYLWTPGGSTLSTASGLSAGIYSVTVTDTKGCNLTRTVQVTQPTSVTVLSNTTTANCNQSNGSATVSSSGGVGPYTYTWSTNVQGPVLSNVPAGTYTIAVMDANGCLYAGAATVPNAAGPSVSISSQTNVSCFGGNNGSATALVTGGTMAPGFPVYQWSNNQNTGTATNLMAGVHTVTITDAVGCQASASVTISQPPALTLNVTGTNPLCTNATNGSANAGVLGGTPGYNYTWTPNPGTGQGSATPGNMGAGVYIVSVVDNNGCIITGSVQLNNPPQMLSSVTSTNVSCFNSCNGIAAATTTNAVGAVSYFYVGGPQSIATQTASNLCAGAYTMTATDQNNCTAVTIFTITQPPVLVATISAVGSVSCSGGSNGFATINASGGTPGYTYNWSNSQTNATSTNLTAGVYTFTVTDTKGCISSGNVTITQPAGLTATVTGTNITCFGANNGIGNVAYSGGSGLPAILWQPSLNTSQVANNLTPGNHTVTLTDGNGCTLSQTLNITQPPQLNAVINNVVSSNCNQPNGSASVTASGGVGGFTYLWSGSPTYTNPGLTNVTAGVYTVIVTDANGCTATAATPISDIAGPTVANSFSTHVSCFGGNNGTATVVATVLTPPITYLWSFAAQTTSAVTNLPNGLHSVTVFDGAGCIAGATFQINQPPQLVSAMGTPTHVTCNNANNGMAPVLVNGGTPIYTYSWIPTGQTNSLLTGAAPGGHTCIIVDANGCITSSSVNIIQPNPIQIVTNSTGTVSCFAGSNGFINTNIIGGTPPYNVAWASTSSVTPAANMVATNLPAGTYSLTATDMQGCSTSSVYIIGQPTQLVTLSTATLPATCGNANGSATVNISGGTLPYNYNWNTPNLQTGNVATGLNPGNWILTTTDGNNCMITASVTIYAPPLPTATLGATTPLCFGQSNGSAWVTPTGEAPFTYNWSPGSLTSQTITGINAGVYTATVTDTYGCKVFGNINVTQPNVLTLNISQPDTICFGQFTQIYAAGAGGTTPYTYSWSAPGGVITSTTGGPHPISPTVTSVYTVSLTDANGCFVSPMLINVKVHPQLLATGFSLTRCDNALATLYPDITSPGNGGPYTFNWSNGATTQSITVPAKFAPVNPNIYTVSISDGCTMPGGEASFTINVNPTPQGTFTSNIVKGCSPLIVNFNAVSNGSNDVYQWNFGEAGEPLGNNANQIITYGTPGAYTVGLTITNQFGCRKDTLVPDYINAYPVPVADFDAIPYTVNLLDPVINFTNYSTGATSFFWDFGDYTAKDNTSGLINPQHTYSYIGTYDVHLVAINSYGCKDTLRKPVEVKPDMAVYIPNAFTPDGNSINEEFKPKGYGVKDEPYKMEIFDRWGELIFTSENFNKGWNGTVKGNNIIAQEGVYVYKIEVMDFEGNKKYFVGHVTLIKQ